MRALKREGPRVAQAGPVQQGVMCVWRGRGDSGSGAVCIPLHALQLPRRPGEEEPCCVSAEDEGPQVIFLPPPPLDSPCTSLSLTGALG